MRTGILLLLLLICGNKGHGIDLALNTSALQNASSGLILFTESPSGTSLNPAYLSQGLETGVTHLFGLSDLPLYTFHAAIQKKNWGFYLGGCHLSHPFYRESTLNISLSYQLESISIGSSCRVLYSSVPLYTSSFVPVMDTGFILNYENLKSGFTIRNLSRTRFQGYLLPVVFIWETNYDFSENTSLSFGIEKERDYDFSLKICSYYRFHPYLALVSSYQYDPERFGAGIILLPESLKITYSILTHRILNSTHFLSVTYGF